jgi:hypothetical protein
MNAPHSILGVQIPQIYNACKPTSNVFLMLEPHHSQRWIGLENTLKKQGLISSFVVVSVHAHMCCAPRVF